MLLLAESAKQCLWIWTLWSHCTLYELEQVQYHAENHCYQHFHLKCCVYTFCNKTKPNKSVKKVDDHVIVTFFSLLSLLILRCGSSDQPLDPYGNCFLLHGVWAVVVLSSFFLQYLMSSVKSISLLWGAGSPPCWRVMIALQEKKLQGYKHKLLSFEKGEHKSQEVLEINPRGQVGGACMI